MGSEILVLQIQFHPAAGSGTVRTLSLGDRGERALLAIVALLALLSASLWFTVPAAMLRASRDVDHSRAAAELTGRRAEADRVAALARSLRSRALWNAGLLNRIAFVYGVSPAAWPKALGPDHRILAEDASDRIADGMSGFLQALERGRVLAAQREAEDPALVRESPAIFPLGGAPFEPSAYFGPRRSPWTNQEEFLDGLEIACPAGTPVIAAAGGVVAFAGVVRRSLGGSLWQLGNVVVLSHESRGATLYGHLARVDVHRGQTVSRGARLGIVGTSGWALSPQLHYEYWRPDGRGLRPTDPSFAVLDLFVGARSYSLEQMSATWAPGPVDPLPGVSVAAEDARSTAVRPRRVRRRKL